MVISNQSFFVLRSFSPVLPVDGFSQGDVMVAIDLYTYGCSTSTIANFWLEKRFPGCIRRGFPPLKIVFCIFPLLLICPPVSVRRL